MSNEQVVPVTASMPGATTSLLELMQFLIESAQRQAFLNIAFTMQRGQIGIVKVEEHYKPGELPIRDRSRLEQLQRARPRASLQPEGSTS